MWIAFVRPLKATPHSTTEDSHAVPMNKISSSFRKEGFNLLLRRVRCHVYYRIKPHTPPFKQAPANLFRFPALRLFPR